MNTPYRFREECYGYSGGQTDCSILAYDGNTVVGKLDISYYKNYGRKEAYIKMVEVNPEYRGKGIGKELIRNLAQSIPYDAIDWGGTTEDGAKLKAIMDKEFGTSYQKIEDELDESSRKSSIYPQRGSMKVGQFKTLLREMITQQLKTLSSHKTQEELARELAKAISDGAKGMRAVVSVLARKPELESLIPTLDLEGLKQMMLSYDDLQPKPREVEEAIGILQSFKEEGLDEAGYDQFAENQVESWSLEDKAEEAVHLAIDCASTLGGMSRGERVAGDGDRVATNCLNKMTQLFLDKNADYHEQAPDPQELDGLLVDTLKMLLDPSEENSATFELAKKLIHKVTEKLGSLMEGKLKESPPEGWHGTVAAMKQHHHTGKGKGKIDNPYALAHWMANKGDEPHYKEQPSSKRGKAVKKEKE